MSRADGDNRSMLWLSATTAFAIIGCTWAFAIARYGGPDEPAHIIRAAAVAHGDLLGKPVAGLAPGYRRVTVPAALGSGDPKCFRHDETITAACAVARPGTAPLELATSAGSAPPWYYAIVGVADRAMSSGDGTLAYRMATVLLCAGILGYAMARSRRFGASPWVVVALTPSAWFLIGVVGTSGIEIALITLALVEAVARFHPDTGRASLARVLVPLAICLVVRPAAAIDVVVVAFVLAPTLPRPVTTRQVAVLASPLALAGAAWLVWSRWMGVVVRDPRTADSASMASALRKSLGGVPTTVHQAVGALGWNEFYAPVVAQAFWYATLAFAAYWVFVHSPRGWWHPFWLVAALLIPTVVEVVVHRRIGEIWQGRYSIPFAMAGVLFAASTTGPSRRVMRAMVIAATCAEVLTLWQTLRRYMVGLDGSLTFQHPSWHPPLNPWLLLVINGAAIAWLASVSGVFGATPYGPQTLH